MMILIDFAIFFFRGLAQPPATERIFQPSKAHEKKLHFAHSRDIRPAKHTVLQIEWIHELLSQIAKQSHFPAEVEGLQ